MKEKKYIKIDKINDIFFSVLIMLNGCYMWTTKSAINWGGSGVDSEVSIQRDAKLFTKDTLLLEDARGWKIVTKLVWVGKLWRIIIQSRKGGGGSVFQITKMFLPSVAIKAVWVFMRVE